MRHELESTLLRLLQQHADGLTEFSLLRALQAQGSSDFGPDLFRDDLAMYRAHFLLFHALYRLRDFLHEQQQALLEIHVLNIRLLPWQKAATQALSQVDPLREFYLDLANLEDTSLADVEDLLGQFWTRYFANEKRAQALQALGLADSADSAEIENRFRALAMQHHPDRGGDAEEFQTLQEAIAILRRCR